MDKLTVLSIVFSVSILMIFVVLRIVSSQVKTNKADRIAEMDLQSKLRLNLIESNKADSIAAMALQSKLIESNKAESVSKMSSRLNLIKNNKSESVSTINSLSILIENNKADSLAIQESLLDLIQEQIINNCVTGFILDSNTALNETWQASEYGKNTQLDALWDHSWSNSMKTYKPTTTLLDRTRWNAKSITSYCQANIVHDPGTTRRGVFFIGNKSTCVGNGDGSEACDPTKLVCASKGSTFGGTKAQVEMFWEAADDPGGVHPDCPDKIANAQRTK